MKTKLFTRFFLGLFFTATILIAQEKEEEKKKILLKLQQKNCR